ncbi:unnamed protein product [Linum trigynum]|uniref:S-adenosyl-L-methionine-dependent methyltransferase superfamily protein n=1 Tax=Linum trigynum TaxID=586398 RepID=A0AAV2EEV6_9ROSI
MSWRRAGLSIRRNVVYNRRFCTATCRRQVEDEGDWFYSSEWWGTDSDGQTVLRTDSDHGNGVVSVLAYPSSRPAHTEWPKTERWLQERYAALHPSHQKKGCLKILGYQWRTLHFNETTRQSTAKVMAAYHGSKPGSLFLMQQPHCLAVPYLKSMAATGLNALACCDYDLAGVAVGKKKMRVLCIGHGGGSLPLFLASKLQGAEVDIVEIDPVVISTSIRAMGFPAFSLTNPSGQRATPNASPMDVVLWKGIHERLRLYEADAENFILNTTSKTTVYDMVFIDAYDGDDIFPRKLWDPDSPFLEALSQHLHPEHGAIVVNLHSSELPSVSSSSNSFFFDQPLPMTRHVSKVCRAYKEVIVGNGIGAAFTVSVPWVCNVSLVVCRGLKAGDNGGNCRDAVLGNLLSRSSEVENNVNLPFSCLEYIKRDFELV